MSESFQTFRGVVDAALEPAGLLFGADFEPVLDAG